MKTNGYTINKGVNRPIEFRGLKAQYIWWLGGGVAGLLAVFAGMYIGGINPFVCIALVGIAGLILFRTVYRLSRRYGQYGWMKKQAARHLPGTIRITTRKLFCTWKKN
jgi:hypothetical protein